MILMEPRAAAVNNFKRRRKQALSAFFLLCKWAGFCDVLLTSA